jgi:hypothetical protein
VDISTLTPEVLAAIQAQLSGANPSPATPAPALSPAIAAVVNGARKGGFLADVSFGGVDEIGVAHGGDRTPLPDNLDYEAEIIKVELTESSSGNEMLKLQNKITFPKEFAGRFVFDNIMTRMEGYPKQRCKSLFRACDLLSEDGLQITAESEQDLKNNVVRFRIKNEEYNGNVNPKVNGGYLAAFETDGLVG